MIDRLHKPKHTNQNNFHIFNQGFIYNLRNKRNYTLLFSILISLFNSRIVLSISNLNLNFSFSTFLEQIHWNEEVFYFLNYKKHTAIHISTNYILDMNYINLKFPTSLKTLIFNKYVSS